MPLIFRSTDIETLADESVWTRGAPAYRLAASPPLFGAPMGPSGSLFGAPMGKLYPAYAEETDPLPPPYACRVVAIAYVDIAFDASWEPKYRVPPAAA